ncbi:hypothetical protein KSP39_PZI015333 [Platanthera zijinensis]|uniref:Small ribosomal subunit protein bS18c n=1 Tax=Platanthera zijinensis TaxID=2320716 RepID=A0AAP0BBE9_9ASPA
MRTISINSRFFPPFRLAKLSPTLQFRLFSNDNGDGNNNNSSFESSDYFERRLFGDTSSSTNPSSFFQKLGKIETAHTQSINDFKDNGYGNSRFMNGQREGSDTLSDGLDWKLKKAANYFQFTDEIMQDDYSFRPDVVFKLGTTYTPKDLDLTKPGIQKSAKRAEFTTTTEEVMKKADFRNVRFLSEFLTEAGIIIKRSQTKIRAKAQRRVAREIKTARAFGLMPFTTMGTKPFFFGTNMEDSQRFEVESGDPIDSV